MFDRVKIKLISCYREQKIIFMKARLSLIIDLINAGHFKSGSRLF